MNHTRQRSPLRVTRNCLKMPKKAVSLSVDHICAAVRSQPSTYLKLFVGANALCIGC